ncbi:hypothetical protein [Spiroplasma endosymbiont of Crioceris asparagi]|uniref:MarR family winged helix-turn-helix transcriptional regulator n=1 Tax=Spiroplasma endosymbiont of Crioceris asparagi TaxID=3066286 RepID=UPI0030D15150
MKEKTNEEKFEMLNNIMHEFRSVINKYWTQKMGEIDINLNKADFFILKYIAENNFKVPAKSFTTQFYFDKALVSRTVKSLESKELLEYKEENNVKFIILTNRGKVLSKKIIKLLSNWVAILDHFEDDEIENFIKFITKMTNVTNEILKENNEKDKHYE